VKKFNNYDAKTYLRISWQRLDDSWSE